MMTNRWRWMVVVSVGVVGLALVLAIAPAFDAAQPHGLSITRAEARAIADRAAREIGIPVDEAWPVVHWDTTPILEDELSSDASLRGRAWDDPVIGPRLGGYLVIYYRKGLEKFPPFGTVLVGLRGEVVSAKRWARAEEEGQSPEPESIRKQSDAFLASRALPGVVNPVFESVRPTVLRGRTDHDVRYRVPFSFPLERITAYVNVHFIGDQFAGWSLTEEYSDGSQFRQVGGDEVAGFFIQYGMLGILLVTLGVLFLRKYHAGEVGVRTSVVLLFSYIALALVADLLSMAEFSRGTGLGGSDALTTAFTAGGIKFLFYDLVVAHMLFFAWAVGESYARERWGERLASFDALASRQFLNATVGRSLLGGVLLGPAVALAILLPGFVLVRAGLAHSSLGMVNLILGTRGGAWTGLVSSFLGAMLASVVTLLFILSFFHRRRLPWAGFVVAALAGTVLGTIAAPIEPLASSLVSSAVGAVAGAAIFMASDLLGAAIAMFTGSMLVASLPLLRVAAGGPSLEVWLALGLPPLLLAILGVVGLVTRREIAYTYDDLAPHVRRIIERERIRAEIDAANRIQAALLPDGDPEIPGISVATHYRAATEIGGDYFDFLQLGNGDVGIAFGDVAGHGLTSGIVMSMAKSALLVQVEYDSSPRRVMEVLNDIVMKVAPKRMMMTFFFGVLDPHAMRLRFSSAGHLDPYVFRAKDTRLHPLSDWGYPLGIRRRDPFREVDVEFHEGDRLVLYSDGLIEALNDDGEPFGFRRFEDVLLGEGRGTAEEIRLGILGSIRKFTRNRPPEDDQTLVVFSFDRSGMFLAREDFEAEEIVVH